MTRLPFQAPDRDRFANASALVVGDIMLDRYWFGDVERISPEAPVPVVHVRREEYRLGGAANVALNINAFGAQPCLLSVTGDDADAHRVRALLDDAGIDYALQCDQRLATTVKLRVSGRGQQLIRIDFEETPVDEQLANLFLEFERRAPEQGAVIFSDYGKGGLAHVARMIAVAKAHGVPTLVDPKGSDFTPYRGATIVTPNRQELARVVGTWCDEAQFEERAQALRAALAFDALLVTRSEEGMSLFDDRGHLRIETEAREVFDVTGAGDTVIAVVGAMLAAGQDLRDAVITANRAAAVVVAKFGTSTVSYEEVFG
ncbi:D-glycero-beta-D-manno-heptose-7-phosphate kinase [uncultured Sphingomonas sp.]|uniref:D-glycero-beta-D-manno-heptose-7-phosphate kinase n=1 Tax=uncultured Sphingomonas sp. TaxID=158754 RepID=UPI0026167BF7|nr:D-glycero-beta-D-manno-heptose-7-phosphate kinase [uncultured Sphingomonas sp.]